MSKLGAYGRTELVRLTLERETPNHQSSTRERTTLSFLSDGTLHRKLDVWFRPLEWELRDGRTQPKQHSYGWKKMQFKFDPQAVEDIIKPFLARGYTREKPR